MATPSKASPITMATPNKASQKKRKRQIQAKTSLNSPYNLQWRPLPQEDMQSIMRLLKDKLTAISLKKRETKVARSWGKRRDKKSSGGDDSVNPVKQVPYEDPKVQGAPEKSSQSGWTNKSARRQLAIGINEVTKALERNELKLVLVCKSAEPPHMTSHLIELSRTRDVPACQVPRLSDCVSGALGLKSVLALGFRRDDGQVESTFSDTVDTIIPSVPSLGVAWLPGTGPSDKTVRPTETVRDEARGQKRKIEDVSPEMIGSVPCALQPLKVKKIIPNPSKMRKPPKK